MAAAARATPAYRAELDGLLRDYAGRPTPLYRAERLSERGRPPRLPEARGPAPHRRAQDQQRARPGPARASAWASRGSSRRPARASTASRRATACALLGLECVVYMGVEDMRRQRRTCSAWSCSARRSRRSRPARGTLKEAISAAIRDWVTNVGDTHYVIGSARGPGAVSGDRARPAARHRRRGARADARARGPAARSRRRVRGRRLERDRHVRAVRRRCRRRARRRRGRGGGARRAAGTARRSPRAARTGVLHGSLRAVLQDDDGQIAEAHSISRRPRLPGRRVPSTRGCATPAAPATSPSTTRRRWPRSASSRGSRGSSPRWSPRTRCTGCSRARGGDSTSSACPAAATRTSPRCWARMGS